MDDSKSSPDLVSALARLQDELAILRLIERHFEQQLQMSDRPGEDGSSKDFKKALSEIRGKIRRLESQMGRQS